MKLVLTDEAEQDFGRIDHAVATRIMGKLLWLADQDRFAHQQLGGKLRGLCKLRVGDWRAIYEVDSREDALVVHFVRHRSKVYKRQ